MLITSFGLRTVSSKWIQHFLNVLILYIGVSPNYLSSL